jgi:hypothetical protein
MHKTIEQAMPSQRGVSGAGAASMSTAIMMRKSLKLERCTPKKSSG